MKTEVSPMRVAVWTFVIGVLNLVQLSLFFTQSQPHGAVLVMILLFVVAPLGQFWMLVDWFEAGHMKRGVQNWMWLFFVPWSFLWYAFDKYEPAESDFARFR